MKTIKTEILSTRQLVKKLMKGELQAKNDNRDINRYTNPIAKIDLYENNKRILSVDMCICLDDKFTTKDTCAVKYKDGSIAVLVSVDNYPDLIGKGKANNLFVSIIAHEIGHILCGHLNDSRQSLVDINKQKQLRLLNNKAYLRSVVFSVLKGGCLDMELEADLEALKIVPLHDLISVHAQAAFYHENDLVRIEKQNRIARLKQQSVKITRFFIIRKIKK